MPVDRLNDGTYSVCVCVCVCVCVPACVCVCMCMHVLPWTKIMTLTDLESIY